MLASLVVDQLWPFQISPYCENAVPPLLESVTTTSALLAHAPLTSAVSNIGYGRPVKCLGTAIMCQARPFHRSTNSDSDAGADEGV